MREIYISGVILVDFCPQRRKQKWQEAFSPVGILHIEQTVLHSYLNLISVTAMLGGSLWPHFHIFTQLPTTQTSSPWQQVLGPPTCFTDRSRKEIMAWPLVLGSEICPRRQDFQEAISELPWTGQESEGSGRVRKTGFGWTWRPSRRREAVILLKEWAKETERMEKDTSAISLRKRAAM